MMYLIAGIVLALFGLMAWIRLAPHDVARFHQEVEAGTETTFDIKKMGVVAVTDAYQDPPQALMEQFVAEALKTPRTRILAGSADSGRITLVTRSLLWGFPDYSTIEAVETDEGSRLKIFARLRFGGSDFGVNAARVRGWLETLK